MSGQAAERELHDGGLALGPAVQGRYRLAVTVALESGAKGAGDYACTVIP